jgi:hypothetical protein
MISLSSCLTTKTSIGAFENSKTTEYTYSQSGQVWIFWGLVPVGRTQVKLPKDCNYQIIERYNAGNIFGMVLTLGFIHSRSIIVKVNPADD